LHSHLGETTAIATAIDTRGSNYGPNVRRPLFLAFPSPSKGWRVKKGVGKKVEQAEGKSWGRGKGGGSCHCLRTTAGSR